MSDDNREHWPTITRGEVNDRLELYGVTPARSKAMDKHAAVRTLRELEALNDTLAHADATAVVAQLKAMRVSLVERDGDYKLRPTDLAGEKWVASVLPALRARKAEIVLAWDAPPAGVLCRRCVAMVPAGHDGVACEFILSCPFRAGGEP